MNDDKNDNNGNYINDNDYTANRDGIKDDITTATTAGMDTPFRTA